MNLLKIALFAVKGVASLMRKKQTSLYQFAFGNCPFSEIMNFHELLNSFSLVCRRSVARYCWISYYFYTFSTRLQCEALYSQATL